MWSWHRYGIHYEDLKIFVLNLVYIIVINLWIYSSDVKNLRAPNTDTIKIFISTHIDIDKFTLHLQNVSIKQLLQIQSGDRFWSGRFMFDKDKLIEM